MFQVAPACFVERSRFDVLYRDGHPTYDARGWYNDDVITCLAALGEARSGNPRGIILDTWIYTFIEADESKWRRDPSIVEQAKKNGETAEFFKARKAITTKYLRPRGLEGFSGLNLVFIIHFPGHWEVVHAAAATPEGRVHLTYFRSMPGYPAMSVLRNIARFLASCNLDVQPESDFDIREGPMQPDAYTCGVFASERAIRLLAGESLDDVNAATIGGLRERQLESLICWAGMGRVCAHPGYCPHNKYP
jgi:hypothetical protein